MFVERGLVETDGFEERSKGKMEDFTKISPISCETASHGKPDNFYTAQRGPNESLTKSEQKMVDEHKKVMLVDDDDTNNFICRRMLKIFDPTIEVIEFIDPEAALEYIKRENEEEVSLLLLDINMPKINAWQFLENLGKDKKEYDIIILTSSIDPKDRMRARQVENIKGFWTKPLSLEMINGYFSNNFAFFS